jgi:hypothetical protein
MPMKSAPPMPWTPTPDPLNRIGGKRVVLYLSRFIQGHGDEIAGAV